MNRNRNIFFIEALEARIAPAAAVFELSTLNGGNGFSLSGVTAYDRSGFPISDAGDINGDGFDDLIIGARGAEPDGDFSGASYVIFGKASGFAANSNLATLDGSNGFKVSGALGYGSSYAVSDAGDVNGDGFDDVIIGAIAADPNGDNSGASYVVFGKASGFAAELILSTLDGSNGFKVSGVAAFDRSGSSVSAAGDLNADGFDDVLIGDGRSGASYVVFGRSGAFAAELNLSALDGTNGFKLSGDPALDTPHPVSAAGDINGDGFDDVLIGRRDVSPNDDYSGTSYVVFGKASGFAATLNLASLDGSNGFTVTGVAANDQSGASVSDAGDVNGDGFDDLIIGAEGADPNGNNSGASYVVFGRSGAFAAELNLSVLDGSSGFKLSGVGAGDGSGASVSDAGDVNGDGFDDLIIGAEGADPNGNNSGASYVVFGRSGAFAAELNLSVLDGSSGFKLSGVGAGDGSGGEVSAGGDVNGDGFGDLMIGAYRADPNGSYSGATYVVFGFDSRITTSGDGTTTTLTDVDGDIVTIQLSKGALAPQDIHLAADGSIESIDLTGAFRAPSLHDRAGPATGFGQAPNFTVKAKPHEVNGVLMGDGTVGIGLINGTGVSLGKVKIDGKLGEIDVGEGVPGGRAFKTMKVDGLGGDEFPGAESAIAGTIGTLKIRGDVKGVLNVTGGFPDDGLTNAPGNVIGKVVIGGNLDGSAGGAKAGLLRVSGGIGNVVVKGDVIGGADLSGIVAGGSIGTLKIGGDLRSSDATQPVTISALGTIGATKAKQAVALKNLFIGGDVFNAQILAGYRRDLTPFNPDASIGSITVTGNWSASSVAAGVADVTGDGFGRNDALIAGDTTPGLLSRIASITIAGIATGTSAADDHFGITAQQIGRVIAGSNTPGFAAGPDDVPLDPVNSDFRAVDFA